MNLKLFLIASLIIHIICGIALYFYYNPITLNPQPVKQMEEESEEAVPPPPLKANQPVFENKKTEKKQKVSSLKSSSSRKLIKKKPIKSETQPAHLLPKGEPALPEKQLSVSEIKQPLPEKTEETPVELQWKDRKEDKQEEALLQDLEGFEKKDSVDSLPDELTPDQKLLEGKEDFNSKDLKDFEEVKDEKPESELQDLEGFEKNDSVDSLPDESIPDQKFLEGKEDFNSKDLEGFEEVENEKPESESPTQETTQPEDPSTAKAASSERNTILSFDSLKQKLGNPSMDYPDFARRSGMEGTVSILFSVTEQGLVDKIQLESSSGHRGLDNFVIRMLPRYEFLPGQKGVFRLKRTFKLDRQNPEIERARPRSLEE